jgi:alginate O-acetyltransferase complex protein AlgI
MAVDGLRQVLWGLFKKIVIADNCAEFANQVFNNSADYSGSTLVLGAVFFAFQIYGDFSGYSDIAIGTSRLFGFNLMQNFATPYFSRDIAEFWRRWHISLSTWFRDYLYIPLGGSRGGVLMKVRNIFVIFLVSGFWHGANWTFIAWGALNAIYFLPLFITKNNRNNLDSVAENRHLPSVKEFLLMLITFGLTVFAWIFFRAENLTHAFAYISNIFSKSLFSFPYIHDNKSILPYLLLLSAFLLVEWFGRKKRHALEWTNSSIPVFARWSIYYIIIFTIVCLGVFKQSQFIYFQF